MDTAALAVIVACAALLLVGLIAGYLQLRQIHAAVNSNMTTALNKIDELHGIIAGMKQEEKEK